MSPTLTGVIVLARLQSMPCREYPLQVMLWYNISMHILAWLTVSRLSFRARLMLVLMYSIFHMSWCPEKGALYSLIWSQFQHWHQANDIPGGPAHSSCPCATKWPLVICARKQLASKLDADNILSDAKNLGQKHVFCTYRKSSKYSAV